MANNLALNLIADVMGWDETDKSVANDEYAWLKLMSSIKYDGYADFRAGVRFVENLAVWLKQFEEADRSAAYAFFKTRLVYISPAELQCLIEIFVPETVTPYLRKVVADDLGVKSYEVWSTQQGVELFKKRLRKTLFVGMSDGSRTDVLRRANAGKLVADQVVPTYEIDDEKWRDLNKELSDSIGPGSKFDSVYFIDDFTASGTTFVRYDKKWKGKLVKFNNLVVAAKKRLKDEFPLAENFSLHVHFYIASDQARAQLDKLVPEAIQDLHQKAFGELEITEGLRLPPTLRLQSPADDEILSLCDRYFDPGLDERLKKHLKASGILSAKLGYAKCALPVILDHNTPNNSIPLLWAETEGAGVNHSMQPLFRRRDRHG